MTLIRISFVLIVWILILSSCSINASIDPIPNRITDTTGNLHYYTLHRMTTMNEHVKWCELHQTWENVETIND